MNLPAEVVKNLEDDIDNHGYLTPEEFAKNNLQYGNFVILVWDANKTRFSQRVAELMKVGYTPLGHCFVHTVYENKAEQNYRLPIKEDVCLMMINKDLFTKNIKNA